MSRCNCWHFVLRRGRTISEFAKADRLLAEMGGIGLAFIFVVAGVVAKNAAHNSIVEDQAAIAVGNPQGFC